MVYKTNIASLGFIPQYIVVHGVKVLLVGSIRPQYIVVCGVDKTVLDYMIIAKAKRPERAFCAFSRLEISFFLITFTFLTMEVQYEVQK